MRLSPGFYKSGRKTVCVIGNYSGRNSGDNALLEGLILDIRAAYGDIRFTVPTINPNFIRKQYAGLNVEPVSCLPWNGCVKLLGLPVWKAIRDADVVLVTDAILFDRALFNPLKNYLSSLSLLLPPAKKRGTPVVLYNVSIGPVATKAGKWCMQRILDASDHVIIRDDISRRTLNRLSLNGKEIHDGGDCALGATSAPSEEIDSILKARGALGSDRPVIGFNMNAYGSAFLRREQSHLKPEQMIELLADAIRWVRGQLGADVWIFSTQRMDEDLCRDLQDAAGADETPLFSNRGLEHRIIRGLMSRLSLMVGMRTHSLILASSVGVPVVGMITYPKTYGYLERIGQAHRSVPVTEMTLNRLIRLIGDAWENRDAVAMDVAQAVNVQTRQFRSAVNFLEPYLQIDGLRPEEAPVERFQQAAAR